MIARTLITTAAVVAALATAATAHPRPFSCRTGEQQDHLLQLSRAAMVRCLLEMFALRGVFSWTLPRRQ